MSSSMSIVQQINNNLKNARTAYDDARAAAMKDMERLSPVYHRLINVDGGFFKKNSVILFFSGIVVGAAAIELLRLL